MESDTKSRLAVATKDYERACAHLSHSSSFLAQANNKTHLPKVRIMGSTGCSVAVQPPDDENRMVGGGGGSSAWDPVSHAAYAAGRTLERCIQEHRFGRKEPVTHKWYGMSGREMRVTKTAAAICGHNFPEGTPWLP